MTPPLIWYLSLSLQPAEFEPLQYETNLHPPSFPRWYPISAAPDRSFIPICRSLVPFFNVAGIVLCRHAMFYRLDSTSPIPSVSHRSVFYPTQRTSFPADVSSTSLFSSFTLVFAPLSILYIVVVIPLMTPILHVFIIVFRITSHYYRSPNVPDYSSSCIWNN